MIWIALGGAGLLGALLLLRAFADASVETIKRALAWAAAGLGVVLLVALLVSGRGAQALGALALLGPLLWRWWQGWRAARRFASGGRASAGGTSVVETATLAMTLNHDTGDLTGAVRRGAFAGTDLADLGLPDLLVLLEECRGQDPESVPLLEAWLDRAQPGWREAAGAGGAAPPEGGGGPMTRAEALDVLGLGDGATEAEIRAAHRRLMRGAHPDQGGSAWLASRLNEARDILLQG